MVKKSAGKVKIVLMSTIVGVVLSIVGVGAGLYFTGFLNGKMHLFSGGNQLGPPIYLDITPAFVVNATDSAQERFMQVAVTVMARNQAAIHAVNANIFAVKNDVREVISGQTYAEMIRSVGIERLRGDAEAAVKKCITERHLPVIDALYFTSFVIQ